MGSVDSFLGRNLVRFAVMTLGRSVLYFYGLGIWRLTDFAATEFVGFFRRVLGLESFLSGNVYAKSAIVSGLQVVLIDHMTSALKPGRFTLMPFRASGSVKSLAT